MPGEAVASAREGLALGLGGGIPHRPEELLDTQPEAKLEHNASCLECDDGFQGRDFISRCLTVMRSNCIALRDT